MSDEKTKRAPSEYLILQQDSTDLAERGLWLELPDRFDTPKEGWDFAGSNELEGRVRVVCLRGEKTGKSKTTYSLV